MDARTGRLSDPGARLGVGWGRRRLKESACRVGSEVVLGDLPDERMTDEDVVDQFLASSVDSAESLLGGDA